MGKKYIIRRYYKGQWYTLGTVTASTEDEAWKIARERYGSPITQVIEYYSYLQGK